MPRLRQVRRAETTDPLVLHFYDSMFGPDRDPVDQPGTASGSPGDWWTVFALDPQNPYRFLEVRATTTLADDDDKAFVRKVFSAYGSDIDSMPELLAEERVIITFSPDRVIAQ